MPLPGGRGSVRVSVALQIGPAFISLRGQQVMEHFRSRRACSTLGPLSLTRRSSLPADKSAVDPPHWFGTNKSYAAATPGHSNSSRERGQSETDSNVPPGESRDLERRGRSDRWAPGGLPYEGHARALPKGLSRISCGTA